METVFFLSIGIGAAVLLVIVNYVTVVRQEERYADTLVNVIKETPPISAETLQDPQFVEYMAKGQKIHAINRLRELTNVGLKKAKEAVEAYFERSNVLLNDAPKKAPPHTVSDHGLRRLIEQGRIEEAIEAYRLFTGVDVYTARDAVEQMRTEISGHS